MTSSQGVPRRRDVVSRIVLGLSALKAYCSQDLIRPFLDEGYKVAETLLAAEITIGSETSS